MDTKMTDQEALAVLESVADAVERGTSARGDANLIRTALAHLSSRLVAGEAVLTLKNGVTESAIRSAAKVLIDNFDGKDCDARAVSDCVRCNAVSLARMSVKVVELLATPPAHPQAVERCEYALASRVDHGDGTFSETYTLQPQAVEAEPVAWTWPIYKGQPRDGWGLANSRPPKPFAPDAQPLYAEPPARQEGAREGWVLVPRVPTDAMLAAFRNRYDGGDDDRADFEQFIAAALAAPKREGDGK